MGTSETSYLWTHYIIQNYTRKSIVIAEMNTIYTGAGDKRKIIEL